ncbi:MAG: cellulose biosynthesis cyclic di-GMP-binding regulatory protein BcsB [Pelolinea sp.]|nr:cellulose biosynthesis cyclic di-GMP-binding regulatory protein BcsB [Pelolinea sp.]
MAQYNLVLISKKDSLEQFFKGNAGQFLLDLPKSLTEEGNGSISVFASPWNSSRAVLIVTGDDGSALQKASAAIAANDFLTISDGNRANITEVSDPLSKVQWQIDYELGDLLNEEDLYIGKLGKYFVEVPFYIPGDIQINPESYFELYFRHSQLINYLQSSITIALNDKVIGTIRFSDQSSSNGLARIILPPNSVRPLKNKLELTFTIVPQDICADERSGNYWISIFRDSYLHLPPVLDAISTTDDYYLGGLLNAFLEDNSLSNLIFIANPNDQTSWKYSSKIAYELGAFSTANMMLPSALFPDSFKDRPIEKDTIMVGQTNNLPFSSGINDMLPLPFRSDGFIDKVPIDGIQFEFNNNQSFGVLEILTVANTSNNVLCVMGNSPEGLDFAFTAAQSRIVNKQGDLKNVEIIDRENISHTFLIGQKSQIINGDQLVQANWFDRLFELAINRIAVYLLIGSILTTLIFSIWALRNGSVKEKEKK